MERMTGHQEKFHKYYFTSNPVPFSTRRKSNYSLYQFPKAAVTKCYTLGNCKQQKFILSQFWKLAGNAPLKVLGKQPGLPLPSFWWPLAILGVLGLQPHHGNLCLHLHIAFLPESPCVFSFFIRTPVIGVRAHPNPF